MKGKKNKNRKERNKIRFSHKNKQVFSVNVPMEMSMKGRMLKIRLNERISLTERKITLYAKF